MSLYLKEVKEQVPEESKAPRRSFLFRNDKKKCCLGQNTGGGVIHGVVLKGVILA